MLASELIIKLQALIDAEGDYPITLFDYTAGMVTLLQADPSIVKFCKDEETKEIAVSIALKV